MGTPNFIRRLVVSCCLVNFLISVPLSRSLLFLMLLKSWPNLRDNVSHFGFIYIMSFNDDVDYVCHVARQIPCECACVSVCVGVLAAAYVLSLLRLLLVNCK